MTEELRSLAKTYPHRSIMKINNILTPPNSSEQKPIHSFQDNHSDTQSENGDFAIEQPNVHSGPLFPRLQSHSSSELSSEWEQREAVAAWRLRTEPDWNALQKYGIAPLNGVSSWEGIDEKCKALHGIPLLRPTEEDYMIMLGFLAKMHSAAAYEELQREWHHPPSRISRHGSITKLPKRRSTPSSNHIRKSSSTSSVADEAGLRTSGSRRRQAKTNLKVNGVEGRQARAPSTKEQKDMDWTHYVDYAPKFTDAPEVYHRAALHARGFDKDNKKPPKNLENDPEVHELHPAERTVAELLQLDCKKFLASKRQIFQGYVNLLRLRHETDARIRAGLEQPGDTKISNWNKTEAQKLLGIDVSKGSWIWQFYKDIGWFEADTEYLYAEFL